MASIFSGYVNTVPAKEEGSFHSIFNLLLCMLGFTTNVTDYAFIRADFTIENATQNQRRFIQSFLHVVLSTRKIQILHKEGKLLSAYAIFNESVPHFKLLKNRDVVNWIDEDQFGELDRALMLLDQPLKFWNCEHIENTCDVINTILFETVIKMIPKECNVVITCDPGLMNKMKFFVTHKPTNK